MIARFVKDDELEEMFDRIDENGDGRISFDEFSSLMREMDHAKTDTELRANFAVIDSDRDGCVSFEEFCRWITG
jgi:Ca2+-binding EF-hand superfamily protein